MASKKVQLSFELTTEKEWREFLRRPGLLVVDLYSEWAGPCVAMNTPLKTLKTSEMAYEWMQLASAPTNIVADLKRLDGTSRPTFVLLSGGRLVNVIFGCNAPEVIRTIKAEIEREVRASQGLERRQTVSLTRLCPGEVAMGERLLASEGDRARAEREEAALQADQQLRRVLTQIADKLAAATVVVLFPYALQQRDAADAVIAELRASWDEQGFSVTREEQMELSREAVDLMFWERRLPQHDALVDSVTDGISLVLMLERQVDEDDEEDEDAVEDDEEDYEGEDEDNAGGGGRRRGHALVSVEAVVARSIYGFLPGTGSSMEMISAVESTSARTSRTSRTSPREGQSLDGREEDAEDEDDEVAALEQEEADKDKGEGEMGTRQGAEDEQEQPEGEQSEEQVKGPEEEVEDGPEQKADEDAGENVAAVDGITASADDPPGAADADGELGEEEADGVEQVFVPSAHSSRMGSMLEDGDEEGVDAEAMMYLQPPVRVWNPRELLPALDSAAARLLFRRDDAGPVLPGIWTPLTALAKAAAVKALFEDFAEGLYEPPTPPPPPAPESTVICFSADKRDEVLDLSSGFADEVAQYGFFTKNRKLLASARPEYEKLVRAGLQTAKTLVVLEVRPHQSRSAPLLELSAAGPLYISATPAIARADVDEFFGPKCARADSDEVRTIMKHAGNLLDGEEDDDDFGEALPTTATPAAPDGAETRPPAEEGGEPLGDNAEGAPGTGEPGADLGGDGLDGYQVPAEGPLDLGLGDGPVGEAALDEAAALQALEADGEVQDGGVADDDLGVGTGEGDAPPAVDEADAVPAAEEEAEE